MTRTAWAVMLSVLLAPQIASAQFVTSPSAPGARQATAQDIITALNTYQQGINRKADAFNGLLSIPQISDASSNVVATVDAQSEPTFKSVFHFGLNSLGFADHPAGGLSYLGLPYQPGPTGLFLQNGRLQVTGDTFGYEQSSSLAVFCSNGGPFCSSTSMGNYQGFDRRVYGQWDASTLVSTAEEPVPLLWGQAVASFAPGSWVNPLGVSQVVQQINFAATLPAAIFSPRSGDQLQIHKGLIVITSNGFSGLVVDWDKSAAHAWIQIDVWNRGAGNTAGGSVVTGVNPNSLAATPSIPADAQPITVGIGNFTSASGALGAIAYLQNSLMSRGVQLGEWSIYNGKTATQVLDPQNSANSSYFSDGLRMFANGGIDNTTGQPTNHAFEADFAITAVGNWRRPFMVESPVAFAGFFYSPWENGGAPDGTAFYSNAAFGYVLRNCQGVNGTQPASVCQVSIGADGTASLKSLALNGATSGYPLSVQSPTANLFLLDSSGNGAFGGAITGASLGVNGIAAAGSFSAAGTAAALSIIGSTATYPLQVQGPSNNILLVDKFGNAAFGGAITAPAFAAGAVAGVSCKAGSVSLASFTATNGIVTHC